MRSLKCLLLLSLLPFSVSCSQRTLSLFFDIPPPREEKPAAVAQPQVKPSEASEPSGEASTPAAATQEMERPVIETVLVWDQFEKLLPKDPGGQADWMEALRREIIKPRRAIDGPGRPEAFVFEFDFFFPGSAPMFDAYFPHSAHTEWLGCDSCHPKIFRTRGTEITMEKIQAGEYCGVCHGRVAFGIQSCARCHPAMAAQ